jgi:uncharacterized protein (TIGR02118 family)
MRLRFRSTNSRPKEVHVTVKAVALWSAPRDADGFEKDYNEAHMPLVAALPGLKGAIASRAIDGPYYRMAELIFDDADNLGAALRSAEGQELLADAGRLQEMYGTKLDVLTVEETGRI